MKRYALKICMLLSVAYAMVRMAHWALGFTYFTQLSNLYVAAAVICQLAKPGKETLLVKYTAVVSIVITFLVYLLVLAPLVPGGLVAAYSQDHCASLCLHVLTPGFAVADYLLLDSRAGDWKVRDARWALLPPLAYFALILLLRACGLDWMGMAAPYPFLNYAAPSGWFGWRPDTAGPATMGVGVAYTMMLMLGVFMLVGRGLLAAAKDIQKARP